MSILGALIVLLSSRYKQHTDMAEHISQMESQFAQLAGIGSEIDEALKMGLFTLIHQRFLRI